MRHLNRYNNFLIKESITDINQIKELIDDYFLEYIDSEESQSKLRLDYWINPKELDQEAISMSSSPSIGDIPCYRYELKFVKSLPVDKVKTIQSRLNADKQFKIISFSATSGYEFKNNSDVSEHTTINLRLSYLINKPSIEPEIVTKMKAPLEKLGYQIDEKEVGNWYLYKRYDEFDLDSNESEDLFPMTSFYRRKIAGSHIPKDNKVQELKDQLLKLYDYDLDSEWNSLVKVIPNLPKPNFRKVYATGLQPETGLQIHLDSRVGKIEWFIRLRLVKKSQEVTELKVMSQVSYYDEIKKHSD